MLAEAFGDEAKAAALIKALPPDVGSADGNIASLLAQIGGFIDQVLALLPDSSAKRALVSTLSSKVGGQ